MRILQALSCSITVGFVFRHFSSFDCGLLESGGGFWIARSCYVQFPFGTLYATARYDC